MEISIIIPTYNPGMKIHEIIKMLDINKFEILIIDSSSTDGTIEQFKDLGGVKVITIPKAEFNHGGTRNLGANLASGDILVYLTQDAIPLSASSVMKLVEPLINDDKIGMSYGRQIPHKDADFFGAFAREFNYPPKSLVKSLKDKDKFGIKTVFCSNSFAAYRKEYLTRVGGFPTNTILSEDTFVAAKMLKNNWEVAYVAEAEVYHSHNYTVVQEFKRYFDIGVFYGRENWILQEFSQAEGEGVKFTIKQLKTILKLKKINLLPFFFLNNIGKILGYRLGLMENKLPLKLKKKISMHHFFWEK